MSRHSNKVCPNAGPLPLIDGTTAFSVERKKSLKEIEEEKKRFFQNMSQYFEEYCDRTGIHGFRYIGEKRSLCEKVSWTIVFIMSLIVCVKMVSEVVNKWHRSPVIVNLASEELSIYNVPFPSVTICPETKVSTSYFNYSRTASSLMKGDRPMDSKELSALQYMTMLCRGTDMVLAEKLGQSNFTDPGFYEFLKKGAPSYLLKCIWMNDVLPCEELFQPLLTDEGLCMTFNMVNKKEMFTQFVENVEPAPPEYKENPSDWFADDGYKHPKKIHAYPRRALLSGTLNALVINLALNNTDIDYGCTSFQGYKVVLHKAIRFPTIGDHHIRVPLKKSVSVAITPSMMISTDDVKLYSMYKRKCFFQSEKKLMLFAHYTQYNCRLECYANKSIEDCGCVEFFLPRRNTTPICGVGKQDCLREVRDDMQMKFFYDVHHKNFHNDHIFSQKMKRAQCICLPMCTAVEYNVEISESDYDWARKMEAVGVDISDDLAGTTSQLIVYFKQNQLIPYERNELYGDFDLLANIGGLLGLFTGFSLLSMIELIYFLSLRIICNLSLYKRWHGNEVK